jgi:hypothetical protein
LTWRVIEVCVMVRLGLLVIGLFNVANGLYMLLAPGGWYASVPGVVSTGPMNPHFIIDIGLAFMASGAGQLFGASSLRSAASLALAGSLWPALHALFHMWGWIAHGFPAQTNIAVSEAVGVAGVSALGMILALRRFADAGAHA